MLEMAFHLAKANISPWLLVYSVFGILSSSINPAEGQRFCGKVLTDTLSAYCEIFPTPRPSKRQVIEVTDFRHVLFPNHPPEIDDQPFDDQTFRSMENMKHKIKWMKALFRIKDDPISANEKPDVDDVNAFSMHDRFELRKRGVVDDCCYKSCTLQYLLTNYCGKMLR
ncbi:uncharacterized protein LOC134223997 [Armigeres subalbatus]|uniref:uncharacterized protein LOC134223997 n=1 Tax=Armigeres subalbatus TaxID=124917 RepID=UPI002ED4F404